MNMNVLTGRYTIARSGFGLARGAMPVADITKGSFTSSALGVHTRHFINEPSSPPNDDPVKRNHLSTKDISSPSEFSTETILDDNK